MTKKIYREILPISRKHAAIALSGGSSENIASTLISLSYHDPNWRWVQELCIRYLNGDNKNLQAVAATCLGHLARIHREIDLESIIPLLNALENDSDIGGVIHDALVDINWYLSLNRQDAK